MPIEDLKGVGNVRKQILAALGMESVGDVLDRLPVRYLRAGEAGDRTFTGGEIAVLVGQFAAAPRRGFGKGGARYYTAKFSSDGREFSAVWFGADYVTRAIRPETDYLVTARVKVEGRKISLLQPLCDADTSEPVFPVYGLANKLSQKVFRKIVRSALVRFPARSMIPPAVCAAHGLSDLAACYEDLHVPVRVDGEEQKLARARERVELEKFYALLLSFRIARSGNLVRKEHRYPPCAEQLRAFCARFPYELTDSQKRAVNDILSDLAAEAPMNRLLQGDVGSGKTAVAACALFIAATNGLQSAVVAPTEVLARQHYAGFAELFAGICEVVLLTSSVTGRARAAALDKIADGRALIVVGTHSVLQSGVTYRNLALAVIDEQHKFGVAERARLVEKGEHCDVLVMSATPIPRTLSMLFYNDLDVSTLREKPAGRGRVRSFLVRPNKRAEMMRYLGEQARRGERVYIVCPAVDAEEEGGAEAVKGVAAELSALFPDLSVGVLYGALKDAAKQAVIADFRSGKAPVLVSTTVIEVGVDVPEANLMAILNADRFGLAQLHQLRGRIGRGSGDGACYFYTEAPACERLEFLKGTEDGFAIAEKDFELRGPGDYFGETQSGYGKALLKMDLKLYEQAKALCDETELTPEFLQHYYRVARERNLEFPAVVLN